MLSEILKIIMHKDNLRCEDIAEMSGVPIETVRNIYYCKVTDPKASTMIKLSKALGVSVNYLMGEGFLPNEEQDLLLNYRKCGNHGKSIIKNIAKYEANTTLREQNANNKHMIPCVVPFKDEEDGFNCRTCEVIEVETNVKVAYMAVEITNNAFIPAFCKGDKILLADRFPHNGERAIFVKDDIGYFRKYIEEENRYLLQPLTGHDSPSVYKRMDQLECIGTYVGVVTV